MINTINILIFQPPFELVITIGGSPSQGVLQDLLCHPFETHASFVAFVASFNGLIADSSSLTADEKAYLDLDDNGTLDEEDRDRWLQYLISQWLPGNARYPFGVQSPTTYAESDPLNLAGSRPNVIIMDPLNAGGVRVTRGTNTCTFVTGGGNAGNLWSGGAGDGNTYLQKLWFNLTSLDEQNWDTPSAAIRRFPADGTPVTIYVRGNAGEEHMLDKEIGLFKNTGSWLAPSKIIIRNYPGDTPKVHTGSSEILQTDPAGSGSQFWPANSGKYRLIYAFSFFRNLTWDGIETVGWRRHPITGQKIFAHKLFRGSFTILHRYGKYRHWRGIPPDAADAATYPDWIDHQFYNRKRMDVDTVINPDTAVGDEQQQDRAALRIDNTAGSGFVTAFRCDFEEKPVDAPKRPDTVFGDTIWASGPNYVISHCRFSGRASHGHISPKATATGGLIEYNDAENWDHSVLGSIGNNTIIKGNRVHHYGRDNLAQHAGIQLANANDCQVIDNVVWGGGQEYNPFGIYLSAQPGFTCSRNQVLRNVVYRGGLSIRPATAGNAVDNLVEFNVLDELPANAKTVNNGDENAVIVLTIGEGETNNAFNNAIRNNIIRRRDGNATIMRTWRPSVGWTSYPIDGVYPLFANNTSADPLFLDPESGDFRLKAGSPAASRLSTAIPLASDALDEEDLLALVCEAPASAGIVTVRGGFDGVVISKAGQDGTVMISGGFAGEVYVL